MIVDFQATEEQTLIQSSVQSLLEDKLPVSRLREIGNHQGLAERAHWQDFTALGVFGLGLPEKQGGVGYTLTEEVILSYEFGRKLISPLVLAQMIAVHLAEQEQLREQLISGAVRAAFANVIDGKSAHLLDGADADFIVCVHEGIELLKRSELPNDSPVDGLDETVALSRVEANFTAQQRTSPADQLSLLVASYLSGIARTTTDMAVEYVKTREQFGHAIGAFQAIKHQCADMHVRAEAAWSQCQYVAATFSTSDGVQDSMETACARLLAREAALTNAKQNIQLHGGMGFTAECEAHLFLKRAHVMSMLGGRLQQDRLRTLQVT